MFYGTSDGSTTFEQILFIILMTPFLIGLYIFTGIWLVQIGEFLISIVKKKILKIENFSEKPSI